MPPSISIEVPASTPTVATTSTDVTIGGTIARAGFVHVRNASTGFGTDGFVTYFDGQGTWFADVRGLGPGENLITATADADGTGARTATAQITVIRPLQPADLIFNAPNAPSASTYWVDAHSIDRSHKVAIFADGTGRSTTGSALAEVAGPVADFTWTLSAADGILVMNCATCSFQKISRISGSFDESLFFGQIETVGGDGELALHAFILNDGSL